MQQEKNNRVQISYWVDAKTQEGLKQLSDRSNLSIGRVIDWLVQNEQRGDHEQASLAEMNKQVKGLRAAVNQANDKSEALIQLVNTVFNIEQWGEADLFDTNTNPANAIVKSLQFAQSKREAAIKSARYQNQK